MGGVLEMSIKRVQKTLHHSHLTPALCQLDSPPLESSFMPALQYSIDISQQHYLRGENKYEITFFETFNLMLTLVNYFHRIYRNTLVSSQRARQQQIPMHGIYAF